MCPYHPVVVFRYVALLQQQKRTTEALLIAQTAAKVDPTKANFGMLIAELQRMQKAEQ